MRKKVTQLRVFLFLSSAIKPQWGQQYFDPSCRKLKKKIFSIKNTVKVKLEGKISLKEDQSKNGRNISELTSYVN